MSALSGFAPESWLAENPPYPGGGQLWCVGPTDWERVAAACALLLSASVDGAPAYQRVLAVVPPDAEPATVGGQVAAYIQQRNGATREQVDRWLRGKFDVRRPPTLQFADLVAQFPTVGEAKTAVVIADVARYQPSGGGDDWPKIVAHAAGAACSVARATEGFALIDAGQFRPDQPEGVHVLESVADCDVVTGEPVEVSTEELNTQIAQVAALADAGDFGAALTLSDELPAEEAVRLTVRAAVFVRAGVNNQAAATLQEIRDRKLAVSPTHALKQARVANEAMAKSLAADFVEEALGKAASQTELEAVLETADEFGLAGLASNAAERLETLAPGSTPLFEHRLARARLDGDHRHAAELLKSAGRHDDADFESWLAATLDARRLDYAAILADFTGEPERMAAVLLAAVRDAQRQRRHLAAVELLLENLDDPAASGGHVAWLTSAMGQALLNDRAAEPQDVLAALVGVIEVALDRLGRHPEDGPTRARLGNLLSTEESGVVGRFALRQVFADRAAPGPDATAEAQPRAQTSDADLKAFWAAGMAWRKGLTALVIGRSRAADTDLPPNFHAGMLRASIEEIGVHARKLREPHGVETLQNYVAVIVAYAHHLEGTDRNLDIEALRLACTFLARAGFPQKARDLVETVLQTAAGDPRRCRAAWIAYGEVHRLTGDPYEAAIATCAALGCQATITPTDAWYELLAVHRLARDLGMRDLAVRLLDLAEALPILREQPQSASRIATMRLQIEQAAVFEEASDDPPVLDAYLDRLVATGEAVLAMGDDPAPIAALLIQTLRWARERGANIPEAADGLAEKLAKALPQGTAERLARFGRIPTVPDLAGLAGELAGARFGRNFAQDVAPLVMLARRHLKSPGLASDGAAFAIELLADHGLLRRDDAGEELPGDLPTSPAAVLDTAIELSRSGLGVCLLGLDETDSLVRVDVADGVVGAPVREASSVFSRARLREWRRDFPGGYAYLSAADKHGQVPDAFHLSQLFDNSVRGLGVTGLPGPRVVLIPDAQLTDLCANLLPVDGAFAGETRAMAVAPSLHWLSAAAARRAERRGPSFAWVPTVGAQPEDVLTRVADAVRPILARAGIGLSEVSAMPAELHGAELAIVGGHGGLAALEGRFFRAVADERRNTISADRLARGLAGAKVAILFVCSGGRLDQEPGAQASLGLARMLLDRGCSAVIGCPWPLSAAVPGPWLRAFLEAWNEDMPVADANAFANEAVRGHPDFRHAMHVYGDPLAARSPP